MLQAPGIKTETRRTGINMPQPSPSFKILKS